MKSTATTSRSPSMRSVASGPSDMLTIALERFVAYYARWPRGGRRSARVPARGDSRQGVRPHRARRRRRRLDLERDRRSGVDALGARLGLRIRRRAVGDGHSRAASWGSPLAPPCWRPVRASRPKVVPPHRCPLLSRPVSTWSPRHLLAIASPSPRHPHCPHGIHVFSSPHPDKVLASLCLCTSGRWSAPRRVA